MTKQTLGTASGGAGSWAANWRWVEQHGTRGLAMMFTDVKGNCPNPYVGEDIDTYRFLVEGAAAIFGRHLTIGEVPAEVARRAEREVRQAYLDYPEMRHVKNVDRAIGTHALWLHYREVAAEVVPELVWLVEGRSIHDVFYDNAWLGNSSLSHCSWELKTKPTRRWLDENCDPRTTTILIGMDWTETHRHQSVHDNYAHPLDKACKRPAAKKDPGTRRACRPGAPVAGCCSPDKPCRGQRPCTNSDPCATRLERPWRVEMPMNDAPKIAKPQVLNLLRDLGVRPSRMYDWQFAHSNCVGCIKAGQGHWLNVLELDPELYAYMEAREIEFQQSKESRATATHLKESVALPDGTSSSAPLSLTEIRERAERAKGGQLSLIDVSLDPFDLGGCVCGVGERPATPDIERHSA